MSVLIKQVRKNVVEFKVDGFSKEEALWGEEIKELGEDIALQGFGLLTSDQIKEFITSKCKDELAEIIEELSEQNND